MSTVVLLDAMGTLVGFPPPGPHLRRELAARGVDVGEDEAARAVRAEIGYYRAHLDRGRDAASLAALHADCAAVVADALPAAGVLDPADLQAAMLAAFRFAAFPEVADELRALRAGGARLAVCSNWDVSLHTVLRDTGLTPLLDAVVTSAELGVSKPDPRPFHAALTAAGGGDPADCWHAGDSAAEDVAGARAAGMRAVLIARDPAERAPDGVPVLPSLTGLAALAV